MKSRSLALASFAVVASFVSSAFAVDRIGSGVPDFWVRPGYKVTVAAEGFGRDEIRFMEFDDKGTLYLSEPNEGRIYALTDKDGDGVYETKTEFVTGKDKAHALQFVPGADGGWLWFTTSGGVYKTQDKDHDGKADEIKTVVDGLPQDGGHWFRSLCVVADGFFTSIGDSQNTGPEESETTDRQKIWKYSLDAQSKQLWSSGIRNTEKLRIRPGTDELWGCDHGSDNFGQGYGEGKANQADPSLGKQAITDLNPPEEFNHYIQGGFYGHPWIVGDRVPRPEYRDRPDIAVLAAKTIPPAYKGGAHWANNGWTFVTKDYFPDAKGDAFIAYHGSWNSQALAGYRVQRVFFDKETGLPYGGYPIVTTLNAEKNKALGRPCDVVEAADGTLLFSDTLSHKIYRISKE